MAARIRFAAADCSRIRSVDLDRVPGDCVMSIVNRPVSRIGLAVQVKRLAIVSDAQLLGTEHKQP
jgi:hypothetical protein